MQNFFDFSFTFSFLQNFFLLENTGVHEKVALKKYIVGVYNICCAPKDIFFNFIDCSKGFGGDHAVLIIDFQ